MAYMDTTEIQDMIRNGRLDELADLIRTQGERIQQLQREKDLLEKQQRASTQKSAEQYTFKSS
jgi:hypothetical protein